jgi:hypothetical protein
VLVRRATQKQKKKPTTKNNNNKKHTNKHTSKQNKISYLCFVIMFEAMGLEKHNDVNYISEKIISEK